MTRKNNEGVNKRYNLSVTAKMMDEVTEIADDEGETLLVIFRRLINIGLYVYRAYKNGSTVIVRDKDGKEKEILWV